MRQPSRRAFLGTAAGLSLGVSGCLDRGGGQGESATDTGTQTPTATPTTTATALGTEQTVGGMRVRVSNLTVQDAVLYLDSPDSMAVANRENEHYVLVSVVSSESGLSATDLSLSLDGERAERAALRGGLDGRAARYNPSNGVDEGYLPFLVPVGVDVEEARVEVEHEGDSAAWELAESQLDALRRPKARFALRDVDIPSTIVANEPVSVRIAAENVSDVAGTFRGVLNVAGLGAAYVPYAFELDADPGETVAWEKQFDETPSTSTDSPVEFFLDTVAGGREIRVPVESREEAATRTENATVTQ